MKPRPKRQCECGCGGMLRQPSNGGPRRFVNDLHAKRQRRRLEEDAEEQRKVHALKQRLRYTKDENRKKCREYRETHRTEFNASKRAYWAANRSRLNAARRARRARQKLAQAQDSE